MKLFPSSVDLCMTNIKCTQLGYSRITQNNYHRFSLNEPVFPFRDLYAPSSLIFKVSLICNLKKLSSVANILGFE